jgi:hypothetical protein
MNVTIKAHFNDSQKQGAANNQLDTSTLGDALFLSMV